AFVRTVLVWHITWSVNSLTHIFGYRTYQTNEGSRNNPLVTLLTFGEGWHNNHHHDQASANMRHRWWELDLNFCFIKCLKRLGLAYDVILPKHISATATKVNSETIAS
ncbi:MAG TPA: acyl-CoA desaturase, partial [Pirellulales bacterium]|nr:acyl-CoA desaturase [Pirellulales bacterium]